MRTEQDIIVDDEDRWWAAGKLIINEGILAYFKAQLQFDGERYFIRNRQGSREEEAYLKAVHGFPLKAVSAHPGESTCHVRLDGGQEAELPWGEFFQSDDTTMGAFFRGIPVRLSPLAMAGIASRLEEKGGSFALSGNRLLVLSRSELFRRQT